MTSSKVSSKRQPRAAEDLSRAGADPGGAVGSTRDKPRSSAQSAARATSSHGLRPPLLLAGAQRHAARAARPRPQIAIK